jgi:hypothetical protein
MARKKMRNLCLRTKCTTLVHRSSEATTLVHLNQNALFRGIEVAKHPFYSIRPKMMFGSVSEHFANLGHAKRCKTRVSGLNTLFRGTEVAKDQLYSIRPKMRFRSVTEHFANLWHVKRGKTCVSGRNALFWGIEVANNPFYYIRPRCLVVFQRTLLTYGT